MDEEIRGQLDALNTRISDMMRRNGRNEDYIAAHQFTMADVITVASLIEKETASADEGYTISSVIYNRLFAWGNTPAFLNIDAAVIYGLDGKTDLTAEDLQTDTPYNTYLNTLEFTFSHNYVITQLELDTVRSNMNDVRVLDGGEADEVVHGFISDYEWWIAVGIALAMDGVIEVVAE